MRNYDEDTVISQLQKKADIQIRGNQITELKRFPGPKGTMGKGDVGIKSKGKIDFLTRYKNYVHFYVDKFERN